MAKPSQNKFYCITQQECFEPLLHFGLLQQWCCKSGVLYKRGVSINFLLFFPEDGLGLSQTKMTRFL